MDVLEGVKYKGVQGRQGSKIWKDGVSCMHACNLEIHVGLVYQMQKVSDHLTLGTRNFHHIQGMKNVFLRLLSPFHCALGLANFV